MSKHTPGPWEVVESGNRWWIDSPNGTQITPSCDYEYEEDKANALLIASAPDYDDFAREAVRGLATLIKSVEELHDSPKSLQSWLESDLSEIKATYEKGLAAILKAEGTP